MPSLPLRTPVLSGLLAPPKGTVRESQEFRRTDHLEAAAWFVGRLHHPSFRCVVYPLRDRVWVFQFSVVQVFWGLELGGCPGQRGATSGRNSVAMRNQTNLPGSCV